jgi:hypothetical protein
MNSQYLIDQFQWFLETASNGEHYRKELFKNIKNRIRKEHIDILDCIQYGNINRLKNLYEEGHKITFYTGIEYNVALKSEKIEMIEFIFNLTKEQSIIKLILNAEDDRNIYLMKKYFDEINFENLLFEALKNNKINLINNIKFSKKIMEKIKYSNMVKKAFDENMLEINNNNNNKDIDDLWYSSKEPYLKWLALNITYFIN